MGNISGFENKDYRNGFDEGYEKGFKDGYIKMSTCNEEYINEHLSIIQDNIAEYGQTNITQEEYDMIYNKAVDDFSRAMKVKMCKIDWSFKDKYVDEVAEQLKSQN